LPAVISVCRKLSDGAGKGSFEEMVMRKEVLE
jgi:hypothetical protein